MKILLIDDSKTMRIIQKRSLLKMDIEDLEILEADSGWNGLESLVDNDVDLIICDISMPGMGGIETLRKIRSNLDTSKIPVIMCTSVADKGSIIEALKAGATNYIIKPFKQEDIESKIKPHIRKENTK